MDNRNTSLTPAQSPIITVILNAATNNIEYKNRSTTTILLETTFSANMCPIFQNNSNNYRLSKSAISPRLSYFPNGKHKLAGGYCLGFQNWKCILTCRHLASKY